MKAGGQDIAKHRFGRAPISDLVSECIQRASYITRRPTKLINAKRDLRTSRISWVTVCDCDLVNHRSDLEHVQSNGEIPSHTRLSWDDSSKYNTMLVASKASKSS